MPPATECYLTSSGPAPFLRLEGLRDRLALPYSTLLGLVLSIDGTALELDFASHKVTVKGKRLYEIFCTIAAGYGQALFARGEVEGFALGPSAKAPFISDIRIKAVES